MSVGMPGRLTERVSYINLPLPRPKPRQSAERRSRVAVCGIGRGITLYHWPWVCKCLDRATINLYDPIILSFGHSTKQIDGFVINWATYNWLNQTIYYLDNSKYRTLSEAYRKRNEEVIEDANFLVAFWDNKCSETETMVKEAKRSGVKVKVFLI